VNCRIPMSSYYTPEQMGTGKQTFGSISPPANHISGGFLQNLRNNRPARPIGSRPPPATFNTWSSRSGPRLPESTSISPLQRTFTDPVADIEARPATSHETKSHTRGTSNVSIEGRALVQPPRGRDISASSGSRTRTPSVQYRESQQRQAEQDEARSVRAAMDDLDLAQEEKLFEAARDEAVELVYKHRNPDAPGAGPGAPYAYPGLTRKGSTRSRSVEPKDQDLQRANSKLRKRHSIGSTASGSRSSSLQSNGGGSGTDSSTMGNAGFSNSPTKDSFDIKNKPGESSLLKKAISDLPDFRGRRKSSGSRRKISGSLFNNPNDQIYEEPEEEAPPAPAPTPAAAEPPKADKMPLGMRRNPFMRFQSIKGNPMMRSNTDPVLGNRRFDRYEIQKNPPTQTRNAAYMLNSTLSKPVPDGTLDTENEPEIKMKDGKEVRSDDLRAATGFRLRDRSPKLPTPTMVTDSPGRPIVSFKKGFNEVVLKEDVYGATDTALRPSDPTNVGPGSLHHAATSPVVPTMNTVKDSAPPTIPKLDVLPGSVAPLRVNRVEQPTLNVYQDAPTRPLPNVMQSKNPNSVQSAAVIPTINLYEDPPTRPLPNVMQSRTSQKPFRSAAASIPTINVFEDTSPRPVLGSMQRSSNTPIPTVAPPIPTINIHEDTTARPLPGLMQRRSNTPIPCVPPPVPTINVQEDTVPRPLPSVMQARRSNAPVKCADPSIPTLNVQPPSRTQSTPGPAIPTISFSETASKPSGPIGGGRGFPLKAPSVGFARPVPSGSVSTSAVPTRGRDYQTPSISVMPDVPVISIDEARSPARGPRINAPFNAGNPPVPSINVNGSTGSTRPLPDPRNHASKPFGRGAGPNSRTHYTPTQVRTGALCTQCALPIAGRIVSAAGLRFHPECFACYQCGEHLECVAFYPEPDNKLSERISRIRARQRGEDIEFLPSHPTPNDMARLEGEDGTDESKRFFCHLDFHEMFSPRCKSCKTPIEGEVIVACGAEWHAGHFFCAQCGDPFDSSTPFVEKDGYAWCVNCHTHRYSTKCKKCRKPVTDTVVKALGAEWHMGCFCCMVGHRSSIMMNPIANNVPGVLWSFPGRTILPPWRVAGPCLRAVRGEKVESLSVLISRLAGPVRLRRLAVMRRVIKYMWCCISISSVGLHWAWLANGHFGSTLDSVLESVFISHDSTHHMLSSEDTLSNVSCRTVSPQAEHVQVRLW
jgi:hypothetical protein